MKTNDIHIPIFALLPLTYQVSLTSKPHHVIHDALSIPPFLLRTAEEFTLLLLTSLSQETLKVKHLNS